MDIIIHNLEELKELILSGKIIYLNKIKYSDSFNKEEMINFLKSNIDNSNYAWFLGRCYENGHCVEKDENVAFKYYKLSADKGNSRGQSSLGVSYAKGIGIEKNEGLAFKYIKLSAEQACAVGENNLGICYEKGIGVEKDFLLAFKYYKLSAAQGYARAQYNVGYCYKYGEGVEKDLYEAFKYYQLSAEQGFDVAQYSLGICYYYGEGVDKNLSEALKYYKLSADQGYARAQNNLGVCYENGDGVEQDYKEAFKYYKLSADQGFADAQCNLGYLYDKGNGVEQDYSEAFKYYKLSADQGFADAQCNLGYLYDKGNGVEQDYKEAFKYYKLSADQGYARAQYNLGVCYKNGIGVEQDYSEAFKYFKLSADQGYDYGQYFLAYCYEMGHGVDKDNIKALKYYKLSADHGNYIGQWRVADFYQYGYDIEKNFSIAIDYYKKAINQNYKEKECLDNISKCYMTGGYGIEKDIVLADAYHYMAEGSKELTALLLASVKAFNNGVVAPILLNNLEKKFEYILDQGEIIAQYYLNEIKRIKEDNELFLINSNLTQEQKQQFSNFLTTEPKDVFISWNHKDKVYKNVISNYLSSNGISVWDSDKNCYGLLHKILFHAIKISRCYLLLLTENSVKSEWVHAELDCALNNNKQIYIIADDNISKIINKLDKDNRFYQIFNSQNKQLGSKPITKEEKKKIIKENDSDILNVILNAIKDNLLQNDFIDIKNKIINENKEFKYTLCNLISENITNYVNTLTTLDDGYIERTLLDENNNIVNINDIDLNNNIFIYGPGGSGKSVVIKRINTLINGNYIPIELNNLDLLTFNDFNSLVDNELRHKSKYENANIDYILKNNINTYFIL
nr:TIR domain-containing protein [Acholeplasmatales bacterium]